VKEGNLAEFEDVVLIMQHLCKSERFVKLLYNTNKDPEGTALPADYNGYKLLKFNKMYPYMKILDLSEEGVNVYVNIYFAKSKRNQGTKAFKTNLLFVDIYSHVDLWEIDTGLRPYKIMNEIDKALNGVHIENTSGSLLFLDVSPLPSVNTKYAGYSMIYTRVDLGVETID